MSALLCLNHNVCLFSRCFMLMCVSGCAVTCRQCFLYILQSPSDLPPFVLFGRFLLLSVPSLHFLTRPGFHCPAVSRLFIFSPAFSLFTVCDLEVLLPQRCADGSGSKLSLLTHSHTRTHGGLLNSDLPNAVRAVRINGDELEVSKRSCNHPECSAE